jgi:hypothetical protein
MAPKHHPAPLSGGDRKALKKELSKSRAMTHIFAERAEEKRRVEQLSASRHLNHIPRSQHIMLLDENASARGIRWRRCLARPVHGPRFAMSLSAHIRASRQFRSSHH